MRTDENLARQSFRFSTEWKRSDAGQLAPEIDARLAGVEKRGDKLVVHSLSGGERNHFFSNRKGTAFTDLSALSGLDNPADSRGFGVIDYDRDGLPDVALVNANQPLFNLYHNEIPASGSLTDGGMIALRFVGGNEESAPSKTFTGRDGYGAKVTALIDANMTLTREHRCGDGFAAQHTATMMLGLGNRTSAARVTIRWPSGKTTQTEAVPEGTLLTCYENSAQAPGREAFVRSLYRVKPAVRFDPGAERKPFPTAAADLAARPEAKIRVYTSMATWCPSCLKHLPIQKNLVESAGPSVEMIAVPIDDHDDEPTLKKYVDDHHPAYRLLATLPNAQRGTFRADLEKLLGHEPGLPSSVITDASGAVIEVLPGLPTLSQLHRLLAAGQ